MLSPTKYYNFFNKKIKEVVSYNDNKKKHMKINNNNKNNTWFHSCANILKEVLALPLLIQTIQDLKDALGGGRVIVKPS